MSRRFATSREVLSDTVRLPRYLAAIDGPSLLLPAWVRAGGGAFSLSTDQLAVFLATAPALQPPPTDLSYTASTRLLASSTGDDATLPLVTSTEAGLAPASGGGTTNFLRADGTWAAPPGGGGGNNYFPGGWA